MRISRASAPAQPPTVTVVVPCYNYGRFLEGCVASILSQDGVRADVLIVDDASTDDSAEVAARLAAADPRVRLDRHAENMGHIATYNAALPTVTADYTVLLSADDLLAPGALGRATALMERHPEVGLVYGHPQSFTTEPVVRSGGGATWSRWTGREWIAAQCRRGLGIIFSPEAVVRTSVHREVGYYDPRLPHSGDLHLWLRIAAVSDVGRINGADQAYRREHPQSMMRSTYGTVLADLDQRAAAYHSFFDEQGARLTGAARLRALADRRMSDEAVEWAAGAVQETPREGIEEAVAFATALDPGVRSRRPWRQLARALATGGRSGALDDLRQRLAGTVRWRRWRHLGV